MGGLEEVGALPSTTPQDRGVLDNPPSNLKLKPTADWVQEVVSMGEQEPFT